MRFSWSRTCVFALVAVGTPVLVASCGAAASPVQPAEVRNCGTVTVRGPNPPTDTAAAQAEQCILTAYSMCQPATLTFVTQGVDASTTITFTIQSGSPCVVNGVSQFAIVPATHTTTPFACARVTPKDGGVLFVGCGSAGDIFVPPPKP
jgi:hypothetical protein